jgi:hypothetical protein
VVRKFLTHTLHERFAFSAQSIEGRAAERTGHQLADHLASHLAFPAGSQTHAEVGVREKMWFACKPARIEGDHGKERGMELPDSLFHTPRKGVGLSGAHDRHQYTGGG